MRFRLLGPGGAVLEAGEGEAEVVGGALVLTTGGGAPLRVPPGDIIALVPLERPHGLLLTLADGSSVELTMLGRMLGQIQGELADARAAALPAASHSGGLGNAERFDAAVGDLPVELRVHDDALVLVPSAGEAERLPYAFVTGVRREGYLVSVAVAGGRSLVFGRLSHRTGEFADLLGERVSASAGRTSAFLASLLPGLGALPLRAAANALRDGLAAPRPALDGIDPGIWPALLRSALRPDRAAAVAFLESLGETWLGFTQTVSVERPAVGGRAWTDSSVTPDFGGHGGGAAGFGGLMQGMALAGGPSMMGLFLLGMYGSAGAGPQHQIKPRADVRRGLLTPATTDHAALTVSGDAPAVRAFLLVRRGPAVIYEVLNEDSATYVFRGDVAPLNRALELVRFEVTALHSGRLGGERSAALRALGERCAGRAEHGDGWDAGLRGLLGA